MNLCERKIEDWKTYIVDNNSPIGFVHLQIGNYLQKGYLLAPSVKPSKICNFCVRSRVVRKKFVMIVINDSRFKVRVIRSERFLYCITGRATEILHIEI